MYFRGPEEEVIMSIIIIMTKGREFIEQESEQVGRVQERKVFISEGFGGF